MDRINIKEQIMLFIFLKKVNLYYLYVQSGIIKSTEFFDIK